MKKFFTNILDWTWCILQNIIGAIAVIYFKGKKHIYNINGRKITVYHSEKIDGGSVSLGKYIILHECHWDDEETALHEYGHTLQSRILGPLYLIVIGLPSLLWCSFLQDWINNIRLMNKKEPLDYYWLYCEAWANKLGGVVVKE